MFDQNFYSHPHQEETPREFNFILKKMSGPVPDKNPDEGKQEGDGADQDYGR